MNFESVKKLKVKYNGRSVGDLAEVDGKIYFQYDLDWLKDGFSLSPFSLPLSNQVYSSSKGMLRGLYGCFFDSLPDGWGELLFRRNALLKGVDPDKLTPLTRLSLVGLNGLGGLNYEPFQGEKGNAEGLDLDCLMLDVQKIWDEGQVSDLDYVYRLGGSSGGARPKAHITNKGEEWIVKFPCVADPKNIGKMEFEANKLAKAAGIDTNDCMLFKSRKCKGFFGAKRFDRIGSKRIHTISLSSILETSHKIPNLDYMHLFQVVQKICINQEDLYEAFRRMSFNVLFGNKDDHGKNFSFVFDESRGGYALSKAFDITQTPEKPEHEMSVFGNGKPNEKDLVKIASKLNLSMSRCNEILDQIFAILQR